MQIKTHKVDVDGIGEFLFQHRSMRLEMAIGAEYSKLINGVDTPTKWLDQIAMTIATLVVLTVESPDGWDIESIDPLNPAEYKKVLSVYNKLCGQEARFRETDKAGGQGSSGDNSPLV